MKRPSILLTSSLVFGLAFMYVPIFVVITYSFNDARLINVWSGSLDLSIGGGTVLIDDSSAEPWCSEVDSGL